MIDLHSHSFFSPDSSVDTATMIETAIKHGIEYYGISEHIELYVKNGTIACDTNFDAYIDYALKLRDKYKNAIAFLIGVEIGFDPKIPLSVVIEYSCNSNIDYIINSVHSIGGEDCYYAESFEGHSKHERYLEYLRAVLQSVKCDYDYQIIGHLGFISRNAPYSDPVLHYSDYADIIDEILKEIIQRDKTLEINTNTCSSGSEYLPNDEILQRYIELGGKNLTFGSDSHTNHKIGNKYNMVCKRLKSLGINDLVIYAKKQKKIIKI